MAGLSTRACPAPTACWCKHISTAWRLAAAPHRLDLTHIADAFDAECWAEALTKSAGIRGLHATTSSSSSPVVRVPLSSCLAVPWSCTPGHYATTGAYAESQAAGRPLQYVPEGMTPYVLLAAWLLWITTTSAGGDVLGAWRWYAHEVLPPPGELDCMLALRLEDVAALPPALRIRALQERAVVGAAVSELRSMLPCSVGSITWALSVARSRSFSVAMGPSRTPCTVLAPLLDLANHGAPGTAPHSTTVHVPQVGDVPIYTPTRQLVNWRLGVLKPPSQGSQEQHPQRRPLNQHPGGTTWPTENCRLVQGPDCKWLALQPMKPLAAGMEVLIDYGARDPVQALCDYGFVM